MKSIKSKLLLSALGVALLATPAFAQKPRHQMSRQQDSAVSAQPSDTGTYPNGGIRSGSEEVLRVPALNSTSIAELVGTLSTVRGGAPDMVRGFSVMDVRFWGQGGHAPSDSRQVTRGKAARDVRQLPQAHIVSHITLCV